MTGHVHALIQGLDADGVRSDVRGMKEALRATAEAGESTWTGAWAGLVPVLAEAASTDLCLGRLVEGHADAMRILHQASADRRPGVYGVWASRSAGTGLRAERKDGAWILSGELRFASGIDLIDRALVPGWVDAEHHLLFDVPVEGFDADRGSWPTTAMDASRSFTCHCSGLAAGEPIGPEDFYLSRAGFAIGGLGPAAVWLGGASSVIGLVSRGVSRFPSSAHQRRRLGVMEQAGWDAANAVSLVASRADRSDGGVLAGEVSHARTSVATACDVVLAESASIVGPGGLTANRRLGRTRDDLALYVRQHHLDAAHESYGQAAIDEATTATS